MHGEKAEGYLGCGTLLKQKKQDSFSSCLQCIAMKYRTQKIRDNKCQEAAKCSISLNARLKPSTSNSIQQRTGDADLESITPERGRDCVWWT